MKRFSWMLMAVALLMACSGHRNRTTVQRTDFKQVASAKGAVLYKNGEDFIQVLKPSEGASLHLLVGPRAQSGAAASFGRRNIVEWFKEWSSQNPRAFSAVNSQFFNEKDPDLALLAFSMKEDGSTYQGYGDKAEYPGKKKLLTFDNNHYAIRPYDDSPETLRRTTQRNGIVGLRADAPKSADAAVGRTYIGVRKNGDVVIFSSPCSTREYAAKALLVFGIGKNAMMMLDGGPSAQLVQGGTLLVSSDPNPVRLPAIVGIETGNDPVQ